MDRLLEHIGDSHCHLDVSCNAETINQLVEIIGSDNTFHEAFFHVMTTNHIDIDLIDILCAKLDKKRIVPYFGIHPWYSHLFTIVDNDETLSDLEIKKLHYGKVLQPEPTPELLMTLPKPISLNLYLEKVLKLSEQYEIFGIGEIGLDKAFRVPLNGYFGNPYFPNISTNKLSPCRVVISHQNDIFQNQLRLANKLNRQVSLHCVKAHGLLFDSLKHYNSIPSIILHSYSGSIDQAKMWVSRYKKSLQSLYFSFSNWINGSDRNQETLATLLHEIESRSILLETDFSIDDFLLKGRKQEYLDSLINVFNLVCLYKGWTPEYAEDIIFNNLKKSIGYI